MATMENKDLEILNKALGAEQFAIAAYELALNTNLLSEAVMEVARTFQQHHGQHAHKIKDAILTFGGEPARALPHEAYIQKLQAENLTNENELIHYALKLEKGAAITYLNAVPEFENKKLAQAAASILGDEAMHWAVLRNALGLLPVHISFIPLVETEVED